MVINEDKAQLTKKKRTWKGWLWLTTKIILILTLLALSAALIFNKQVSSWWVKEHTKPQKTYLAKSAKQLATNAAQPNKNFDSKTVVPVSPTSLMQAAQTDAGERVIGGIAVPDLGINLPIMADDGYDSMLYGAGPLKAGQVMGQGNYGLASHDMWTNEGYYSKSLLFTPLKWASAGQKVYITDKTNVYQYTIDNIEQIKPSDWDKANADTGSPTISLVTCDTDASYRVLVTGHLTGTSSFSDMSSVFTKTYNQYKG